MYLLYSKHGFPTNTVPHRSPPFLSPEPDVHGLRRTGIATKVFLSTSMCDTSNGSRSREVHIKTKKKSPTVSYLKLRPRIVPAELFVG